MTEKLKITNSNLSSGADVEFRINGYMTEDLSSEVFKIKVPKFPSLISKANVYYGSYRTVYQTMTGTSSFRVQGYQVVNTTQEGKPSTTPILVITPSVSTPFTTIVGGDIVQFSFADPAISHLTALQKPVVYKSTSGNLRFNFTTTGISPLVVGNSDFTLSGRNVIEEVVTESRFAIAKEFVVSIDSRSIWENLEINEEVIQVPVFAYSQSASPDFTGNEDRYIMTPGVSRKSDMTLITKPQNGPYVPPSYYYIDYFLERTAGSWGVRQSNRSFMTNIDKERYFRFYVTLVEYYKAFSIIQNKELWYARWMQTDAKGNPIWKQATVRPQ